MRKKTTMKSLILKIAGPVVLVLGAIGAVVLRRRSRKGATLQQAPADQSQASVAEGEAQERAEASAKEETEHTGREGGVSTT